MAKKSLRARVRAWMIEYAYLVTLGTIAAIVASSALYAYGMRRESSIQAAAQAPEIEPEATNTPKPELTPLPTIAPLTVRSAMITERTAYPVSGEIVRGYDAQEAVYWETLACYKPHTGLDIAGEAGEDVCAIADCTVEAIRRDELWGMSVETAIADGRSLIYRGLEMAAVREGQKVSRGQPLGTLMGRIPCEGEMGAHLHVELIKAGRHQEPEAILPEKR